MDTGVGASFDDGREAAPGAAAPLVGRNFRVNPAACLRGGPEADIGLDRDLAAFPDEVENAVENPETGIEIGVIAGKNGPYPDGRFVGGVRSDANEPTGDQGRKRGKVVACGPNWQPTTEGKESCHGVIRDLRGRHGGILIKDADVLYPCGRRPHSQCRPGRRRFQELQRWGRDMDKGAARREHEHQGCMIAIKMAERRQWEDHDKFMKRLKARRREGRRGSGVPVRTGGTAPRFRRRSHSRQEKAMTWTSC